MLRKIGRWLPHSYWILALGAVFVAGIDANMWLRWRVTGAEWPMFVAGMLTLVYLSGAIMIVITIPKHEL
jgi:hypothetical protein